MDKQCNTISLSDLVTTVRGLFVSVVTMAELAAAFADPLLRQCHRALLHDVHRRLRCLDAPPHQEQLWRT